MKRIALLIRVNLFLSGLVILALAGGIFWFFFVREAGVTEKTLVVHPDHFLQQVSVSGKVVAAQDVDLGFVQGGKIARLLVKVGDTVSSGALLAETENGDLRAALLQKQAALQAKRAELVSLLQGTRSEQLAVTRSEVASDEQALIQANQALADTLYDSYTKSDDAVRNQIDQLLNNPRTDPKLRFETTNSQLAYTIETKRLLLEARLLDWQKSIANLTVQGELSSAVLTAQDVLVRVIELLTYVNDALNVAIPNSSVTESDIAGYVTDIVTARTTVNTTVASLTTKVTAQKSASTTLDVAKKNLALEEAGPTEANVDAKKAEVGAAEADVAHALAQLQKTMITAPFTGTVTAVPVKVGQIVSSGAIVISLIDTTVFEIESYVPELNIASIGVGDTAEITLDAYGPSVLFNARVILIDPAETVRDGVSMYRAVLRFTDHDSRVRAGMTANVVITTEDREDVISVPQGIVTLRDGKRFVLVKEGKTTVEREVTTGSVSSFGNIEIVSGLTDGDIVVLSAPR